MRLDPLTHFQSLQFMCQSDNRTKYFIFNKLAREAGRLKSIYMDIIQIIE